MKHPLPFLCFLLAACAASASPAPPGVLAKEWARIESPSPQTGCRAIISFIVDAAGGPDYAQYRTPIEIALGELTRMQDRDPASKTYGNFCWYWHELKPGDLNAVEFVTQQAVLLRLEYAQRLSPAALASLGKLLNLAVEGIHRQQVVVEYTNIFLMKSWNLMALGEALKEPKLFQEGYAMLEQWMAFTSANGIREYVSPTYYSVDLDSLALMNKYLADPAAKAAAGRCLDLFWQDIAANWFAPAGRLGGAHGRDYDYLTGHGELDRHLEDAGWIATSEAEVSAPSYHVFADATRWTPPAELHRQAVTQIPRFVFQKWDKPGVAWASQYIGHHFSIGVAGCSQGPEDKPFALNVAGPAGPKTVMVNFFMDGRDDPYGKNKIATGASGHPKSHHLDPFFCAVQSGREVLFLASYPYAGRKPETEPACLRAQMDLPAEAEVWAGEMATDPSAPPQMLPGNICFLRMGDVAVGIRFLLAVGVDGKPVTAQLINDGAAYSARRLTASLSDDPPGTGRGTVAVWVLAAEGLDQGGFAAFRRSFAAARGSATVQGTGVRVKAAGLKGELVLDADLAGSRLLGSKGADPAMEVGPMSIDGKAFGGNLVETGTSN